MIELLDLLGDGRGLESSARSTVFEKIQGSAEAWKKSSQALTSLKFQKEIVKLAKNINQFQRQRDILLFSHNSIVFKDIRVYHNINSKLPTTKSLISPGARLGSISFFKALPSSRLDFQKLSKLGASRSSQTRARTGTKLEKLRLYQPLLLTVPPTAF